MDKLYKLVMAEMAYAKALDLTFFNVHSIGESEATALLDAARTHRVEAGQLMLRWEALKNASK